MIQHRLLLILLAGIMALDSAAQSVSFDEYRRQQQQQYRQYKSDKQKQYDAYRKQLNEQYAQKMSGKWDSFKPQPAIEPVKEEEVKPVVMDEPKPIEKPKPIEIETVVVQVPKPAPAPAPIAPVEPQPQQSKKQETVDFYGTAISIDFPLQEKFVLSGIQEQDLAAAWKQLSDETYDILIHSLLTAREKYQLCDWGFLQLVQRATEQHYGSGNKAVLVQGFLMTQAGYKVRLATNRAAGILHLLINCQYTVFNKPYYTIDGQRFIGAGNVSGTIEICPALFEKEQPLSLQIAQEQNLTERLSEERVLKSKKGLSVAVQVNTNNIAFYNDYPSACLNSDATTRWAAYANTPMDRHVRESLYPALRKSLAGLSEKEAVVQLLNWVQTAFTYKLDNDVWGGDRAFFAVETLYYPYSDCEDRAILFSRLVRDILGMEVVLLYYPGHLATAVYFQEEVNGDYLQYNSRKFVVCDPTYMNAGIGRTMPGMDNQKAKVIAL